MYFCFVFASIQFTATDPIEDYFNQTTFLKTPIMSSYLVCFIVCDLEYKENTLANGKPVSRVGNVHTSFIWSVVQT